MLIQVVFIAALFIALFITWKRANQSVISRREALMWSVVWIGASLVILLPQTTTMAAQFFGVGRGADFMLYGSVIVLFFLVFKVFIALDKLDRQLTEMVRRDALKDLEKFHD